MGVGVLIGFFILMFVLLMAPLSYLYFKKRKRKWIGVLSASIIVVFVFSVLFMNTIDEVMHTKNDTRKDLNFASIKLNDDFEIVSNNVGGMPERLQYTKVRISQRDRDRIIDEIKNAPDFLESNRGGLLYERYIQNGAKRKVNEVANYKFNGDYIRESVFDDGEYVPIRIVAYLNPKSDTLVYDRIEN